MPGRPTKPTRVKQAQGTDRKCRILNNEMLPTKVDGLPEAPEVIAKNKSAVKLWHESVVELESLGMLHSVDLPSLAAYCMEMSTYFTMTSYCELSGYVDADGRRRAQDLIRRDCLDRANKIAQQFGFIPSARTKISMPKRDEGTEFFD